MTAAIDWLCVEPGTGLLEILRRHAGAVERRLPAGIALVVDRAGMLVGTVTDGDVRRAVLRAGTLELTAGDAMSANPITFRDGTTCKAILEQLPGELQARGRRSARFLGKIVLVDDAGRPTRVLDYHQLWEQRVAIHRHVVVVGMGYVGLTLALELAKEGFVVTGVDVDGERVSALARGESDVHEVGLPELLREQLARNFSVACELPDEGDVFIVAVGTPVTAASGAPVPNLDHLCAAVDAVGARLRPGALVVLRSTVPLGTTRTVVAPRLEQRSGLRAGVDFHLSFAPERTAEGRALQELRSLPQLVGGINDDSVEATVALFRELTPTMVRLTSLEAAELAKLINNGFRDVKFAFANEMAQLAGAYNLDVVEVVRAANRGYPRDPVPLPSPGVGGPCLTKDPHILAASAAAVGLDTTLSAQGRAVNTRMHGFVADAVVDQLAALGKDPRSASVLVCGLAFKGEPETGDLRESSSVTIAERLRGRVGRVFGHDPVAQPGAIAALGLQPVELPAGFDGMDAVLFLTNHRRYAALDVFSMARALRSPAIVYDAWRLFEPEDVLGADHAVYMGLGFVRTR